MSDVTDLLIATADRLFADHVTPELHRSVDGGAWPEKLWNAMDEAGLNGAALPEPHGSGVDKSDAAAVLRRAGYHTAPGPTVETTLAGWVLATADALPATDLMVAALGPGQGTVSQDLGDATISSVPWPAMSEGVLAWCSTVPGDAATADGNRNSFLILRGGSATSNTDAAGEPMGDVTFDRKALASADLLQLDGAVDRDTILAWGAILTSAELSGLLDRVLENSIAYAQERVQFGRAIGKFQAVQQLLAEAAGEVAAASAISNAAMRALDDTKKNRLLLMAAAAKARTGEAAGRVATISHQIHGAIGYTREFDLHRATRRLWRGRDRFGTERYWQRRLGEAAAAAGADSLWPFLADL